MPFLTLGKLILSKKQGVLSTIPWPAIAEKEILTIMVNDDDLNYQTDVVDIISVSSQSVWITTSYPTPGDKEYVGLAETGKNTGVFTGLLNTSSGLQVRLDVNMESIYGTDAFSHADSPQRHFSSIRPHHSRHFGNGINLLLVCCSSLD